MKNGRGEGGRKKNPQTFCFLSRPLSSRLFFSRSIHGYESRQTNSLHALYTPLFSVRPFFEEKKKCGETWIWKTGGNESLDEERNGRLKTSAGSPFCATLISLFSSLLLAFNDLDLPRSFHSSSPTGILLLPSPPISCRSILPPDQNSTRRISFSYTRTFFSSSIFFRLVGKQASPGCGRFQGSKSARISIPPFRAAASNFHIGNVGMAVM